MAMLKMSWGHAAEAFASKTPHSHGQCFMKQRQGACASPWGLLAKIVGTGIAGAFALYGPAKRHAACIFRPLLESRAAGSLIRLIDDNLTGSACESLCGIQSPRQFSRAWSGASAKSGVLYACDDEEEGKRGEKENKKEMKKKKKKKKKKTNKKKKGRRSTRRWVTDTGPWQDDRSIWSRSPSTEEVRLPLHPSHGVCCLDANLPEARSNSWEAWPGVWGHSNLALHDGLRKPNWQD